MKLQGLTTTGEDRNAGFLSCGATRATDAVVSPLCAVQELLLALMIAMFMMD